MNQSLREKLKEMTWDLSVIHRMLIDFSLPYGSFIVNRAKGTGF